FFARRIGKGHVSPEASTTCTNSISSDISFPLAERDKPAQSPVCPGTHPVGYRRSATQSWTPATADGNALASDPPPIAISGRPPPLPPICVETCETRSPALILAVRSCVTPAATLILPSLSAASRTT